MIDAAIVGAQMKLVRSFLAEPSQAADIEDARFKGKLANHFDQLATSLGYNNRQEFTEKFTNSALEQFSEMVISSARFVSTNASLSDNQSPSASTGISGQGISLA